MRLPYIQVETEIIEQLAPDLATELGIEESDAGWGIVCFFKWALGRCSDDKPPSASAVVSGPSAAKLVAKSARFRGDSETFVDACARSKPAILERVDDGIRIRGLARYDSAWGKNHPEEWKAWKEQRTSGTCNTTGDNSSGTKPGRNRAGTVAKPDRKTKTKTKNKEDVPKPEAASPKGSSGTKQPSDQQRFAEWFEKERREALNGSYSEDRQLPIKRLNSELQWVKEAEAAIVQDAVRLYFADEKRRQQDPPCSLLWFSRDRAVYISKAKRGAA